MFLVRVWLRRWWTTPTPSLALWLSVCVSSNPSWHSYAALLMTVWDRSSTGSTGLLVIKTLLLSLLRILHLHAIQNWSKKQVSTVLSYLQGILRRSWPSLQFSMLWTCRRRNFPAPRLTGCWSPSWPSTSWHTSCSPPSTAVRTTTKCKQLTIWTLYSHQNF